jgi:O-antigen/teichoic acid export membrane protein
MTDLARRVLAGMGANASGQVVTFLTQLASVPLFLHFWPVEQYGQWLLLSAIPAYLSLSDLGITSVAMNRMTMLSAQGHHAQSNAVFHSALVMTAATTLALFFISLAATWLLDIATLLLPQARQTLTALIAAALLNVLCGLIDAVFRASDRFVVGTYLISLGRLLEWVGGMLGLLLTGTMLAVALGFLAARALFMIGTIGYAHLRLRTHTWSCRHANREEVRALLPDALAFLAFPLGNAITLQGSAILVGHLFGPVALALFSTCRTLSRIPLQLLATFSRALWPEMSRQYALRNMSLLERMRNRGTRLSLAACVASGVAILIWGGPILELWTNHRIAADASLLAALVVVALANCAWQIDLVLLSATNQHRTLAMSYLVTSVLCILLAAAAPASVGLYGVIAALLLFEAAMAVTSRRLVSRSLGLH